MTKDLLKHLEAGLNINGPKQSTDAMPSFNEDFINISEIEYENRAKHVELELLNANDIHYVIYWTSQECSYTYSLFKNELTRYFNVLVAKYRVYDTLNIEVHLQDREDTSRHVFVLVINGLDN